MENGPADTLNYMYAGFAVIFGAMLAYFVSLIVRLRNLRQDNALLDEVARQEETVKRGG